MELMNYYSAEFDDTPRSITLESYSVRGYIVYIGDLFIVGTNKNGDAFPMMKCTV